MEPLLNMAQLIKNRHCHMVVQVADVKWPMGGLPCFATPICHSLLQSVCEGQNGHGVSLPLGVRYLGAAVIGSLCGHCLCCAYPGLNGEVSSPPQSLWHFLKSGRKLIPP
ncbi:hypothetical protein KIL84_017120 [Mauremys mutica]|uniref:Uncharacterized protein n=1 Tax=Mauremys mutica TaxID=74926 RepID=A0A9D4AYB8_9SAUR|nr:hypothetical protein KIL84_017120 [Mauremys mutica]